MAGPRPTTPRIAVKAESLCWAALALHGVLRHRRSEGAVGDVGQGVEEAKRGVSDVGVDVLGGRTVKVREAEQSDARQQKGER